MALISAAPTIPRVDAFETRWSEITSDSEKSVSFDTHFTFACAARSGVRWGLHAMTFMLNACPYFAAYLPRRPRRSEEHTSELQSPSVISYAVFCLKKKKK